MHEQFIENTSAVNDTPLQILKKYYGYGHFRGDQAAIIDHVIGGNNAFVLMPTGSGKSLCYQIPSICRQGVGIVISPLIALMQDQVSALKQLGICAEAINSTISNSEITATLTKASQGYIDLLYVAPERLLMSSFLKRLENLEIALFAIDEAHCVSQWGHDFRPDYAQLSFIAERFADVPRIALTATADKPTRKDIIERLKLSSSKIFIGGFDRPNIHYTIVPKKNAKQQVIDFIRQQDPESSGIIYCLSRRLVDQTCHWLCEQGLNALSYHAGMSSTVRDKNQRSFLYGEGIIMVATIAFGMGIDKPDVRFVVHLNIPKNIEAYYQETGRAGRDGLPAMAMMLYGLGDTVLLRTFIERGDSHSNQKRIEHQKLNTFLGLCEAVHCRRQILLAYFGDSCEPCGNCDNCQQPPETFDGSIVAQKALSCVYRTGQRFGVNQIIDVLQGKTTERVIALGHNKLSTFGIGEEFSKPEWQSYLRQLVVSNLLEVAITEYGGLKITHDGQVFLKQKPGLPLRKYTSKSRYKSKIPIAMSDISTEDMSLFERLKDLRLKLAKEKSIPPYVVFHDKTLYALAIQKPATLDEMAMIDGVGDVKLKRYGPVFLQQINT